MNSSEMYLKISKNIFDCLNSAKKEEIDKKELNENLFLQLSFLTKFVSGKDIQENPNFNFFVSNKKSVVKDEIDKSILKEENIIDDIEENEINDDKEKSGEFEEKKENEENDNGRFENDTNEIDDQFDLQSRQSICTFKENNNLNQSNYFNTDKNNTFDLSNVGDCSIICKDNQSLYNEEESFFGIKNSNIRSNTGVKSNPEQTRFSS